MSDTKYDFAYCQMCGEIDSIQSFYDRGHMFDYHCCCSMCSSGITSYIDNDGKKVFCQSDKDKGIPFEKVRQWWINWNKKRLS